MRAHAAPSEIRRCRRETFRSATETDTQKVITELARARRWCRSSKGNGTPAIVERVLAAAGCAHRPDHKPEERKALIAKSPVAGVADTGDRSRVLAFEMLQKRV
ncbi:MAG: helicase HerA-like domain-containing protein [Xanthobacteraceae bacterium]